MKQKKKIYPRMFLIHIAMLLTCSFPIALYYLLSHNTFSHISFNLYVCRMFSSFKGNFQLNAKSKINKSLRWLRAKRKT